MSNFFLLHSSVFLLNAMCTSISRKTLTCHLNHVSMSADTPSRCLQKEACLIARSVPPHPSAPATNRFTSRKYTEEQQQLNNMIRNLLRPMRTSGACLHYDGSWKPNIKVPPSAVSPAGVASTPPPSLWHCRAPP